MKYWYWSQPMVAAALALVSIYTVVCLFLFDAAGLPSFQFMINGTFVFPGLVLSFGVNQLLLARRAPRSVTRLERWLLGVEYALIAVLILTSFGQDALLVGLILWVPVIVVAVAVAIAIPVTTARLSAPKRPGEPTVEESPGGGIDELFGR